MGVCSGIICVQNPPSGYIPCKYTVLLKLKFKYGVETVRTMTNLSQMWFHISIQRQKLCWNKYIQVFFCNYRDVNFIFLWVKFKVWGCNNRGKHWRRERNSRLTNDDWIQESTEGGETITRSEGVIGLGSVDRKYQREHPLFHFCWNKGCWRTLHSTGIWTRCTWKAVLQLFNFNKNAVIFFACPNKI